MKASSGFMVVVVQQPLFEVIMGQTTPARIMVIGTDLHFCYLMRRYVRESDHPLLFAGLDEKAIETAQCEKPALIIMEGGTPATQSLQMIQQLKANIDTHQIPVVYCSWHDEDFQNSGTGADICLQMPVLYSDFLAALNQLGI